VTGTEDADEELLELRYVGPATASTLAAESVTAADVREKRVSYQLLVDAGINAGVATKIRRWHSLPWTFDGEEHHLDRRSQNVRHLQDDEREWVAASSDWREDDAASSGTESDGGDETALTDDDWERDGAAARDENASRGDDRPVLTAGDWQPAGDDTRDDANASADAASDDPLTDGDWTPDDVGGAAETDGSGSARARESAWRREARADPVTAIPGLDEDVAATLVDASVTSARRLATADPEHVGKVLDLPTETVREWVDAASNYVDG